MRLPDLLSIARSGDLARVVRIVLDGRDHDGEGVQIPAVDYVRFKPGTSCLFGLGTTTPRPLGYVKVFLAGGADACFEKYRARERADGRVERLPGLDALLFRFPLDRAVTGLPAVIDPSRLKHVLHECVPGLGPGEERVRARKSRVEIVRYKPERRCLVRADLSTRHDARDEKGRRQVIAQAYADDSGARVFGLMKRLSENGAGEALRIPRPLGWSPTRRVLVQERVPGTPWGERLESPDAVRGCVQAARMLRDLHSRPAPAELPVSDPWRATAEAVRVLQDLGRVGDPGVAAAAADLGASLARGAGDLAALPATILHGDFHYHQLLVDGDRATLIDWDETRRGDPREDVGNFVAHLLLRELQGRLDAAPANRLRETFLHELGAESGLEAGLPHFTAVGLAKLALVPFRNLESDWRERTLAILDRARALVTPSAGVRP